MTHQALTEPVHLCLLLHIFADFFHLHISALTSKAKRLKLNCSAAPTYPLPSPANCPSPAPICGKLQISRAGIDPMNLFLLAFSNQPPCCQSQTTSSSCQQEHPPYIKDKSKPYFKSMLSNLRSYLPTIGRGAERL